MLSLNSKHVQHVKIYLACNFKVNLITHLEVISKTIKTIKTINNKYLKNNNNEKRAITPRLVIRFTSKLQGMLILTN
jgi:hypothetical protein